MSKKLDDLYQPDSSLHEGVWKKIKGAWDSESNAKPLPAMPPKKLKTAPGPIPSKKPEGLSKAGMIGIGTGVVTMNPLAGLGAYYLAKQWKKAK